MNNTHYLTNIYCGKVAVRYGIETAIDKQPINTNVYLSFDGLAGDECADKLHHGGLERALHQYPAEHYGYWQEKYNSNSAWQAAGMGENMSSIGMTEQTVCLGDRYQWGEAIIEVSQPRSPCFKLNKRWGIEGLSVDMQDVSRSGWLYRVIQPGMVSVEEPLELIDRVDNAMTITAVCETFFGDPLNTEKLLKLKEQNTLSASWMEKVEQRLVNNEVENWNFRLLDHA
ncbi:MOSC domain-containing protein [Colwellia psychrerythraea]|uniref:MOSC domain containing protein n=1 Tax=Colwellia psychrerythraea TaxID=28229 RepID=A0A099KWT3_COLPS|nr:MOSC domain-containing protein [Colwellia psychrerythraea]KGJ94625.1 MOSC domain containing protein [Colwellia psychrerythraea]